MIMGMVLAAGEARRMGAVKQLLDWHGQPILRRVIGQVLASNFDLVTVVLGAYKDQIISVVEDFDVECIYNPDYKKGQSTSVGVGLKNCSDKIDGVAFILGDQPLIQVETYNYLIKAFKSEMPGILVPTYEGQRGNPIFFHRRFFDDLLQVEGDRGGREIIQQNKDQVVKVEVNDPGILLDIDNKEEYFRLLQNQQEAGVDDENTRNQSSNSRRW